MLENIPLLPLWIIGAPFLMAVVELIRTPRRNSSPGSVSASLSV